MEVQEWYVVKISDWFAALENLDDNMDINRVLESNRENIKTSAKESLGHYKFNL